MRLGSKLVAGGIPLVCHDWRASACGWMLQRPAEPSNGERGKASVTAQRQGVTVRREARTRERVKGLWSQKNEFILG